MIDVAGVTVPRAAVAKLASVLHRNGNNDRAIGHRLGQAIDKNLDQLPLSDSDAQAILATLQAHPIDELEPLRRHLVREHVGRERDRLA